MTEMENHRSVEWKNVSKIRLFLILASLAWLVFCLIFLILQETNKMTILIHFFSFFIDKPFIIYSLFLLGTLWLMALLAFLWKKVRKKVAKAFLILGWILAILAIPFESLCYIFASSIYHDFPSPYRDNDIVVEEYGFLLLSNITLHERQNPFFIQEIEGAVILPDDGYLPISQGEYWVKWNKNVFTLAVDRGYADGSWLKMKVTLGEGEKEGGRGGLLSLWEALRSQRRLKIGRGRGSVHYLL